MQVTFLSDQLVGAHCYVTGEAAEIPDERAKRLIKAGAAQAALPVPSEHEKPGSPHQDPSADDDDLFGDAPTAGVKTPDPPSDAPGEQAKSPAIDESNDFADYGVPPAAIDALHQLGVTSVEQLREYAAENALTDLPDVGKAIEKRIRTAIAE